MEKFLNKRLCAKGLTGIFFIIVLLGAIYIDKPLCFTFLSKIQQLNGWDAVFCLSIVYILSNLLVLPLGLPLNLLAGMLWGAIIGGILINFLATVVAAISFIIGRWFERYFLEDSFHKYRMLDKFKSTINKYDWQFIALARINPIVPFGLSNYFFGIIPEFSFRHYIIVTAIANLIPCLAFSSIGSLFKTFSLNNASIHRLIIDVGVAFLFISSLFILKIMVSYHQNNRVITCSKSIGGA